MTVHNADVAWMFNRLADLLELDCANPFRMRAYRDAPRIVDGAVGGERSDRRGSGQGSHDATAGQTASCGSEAALG